MSSDAPKAERSRDASAVLRAPPEAWAPLLRLARLALRPLERFLQIQAASGLVLLATAGVALAWANSPWAASYAGFWHTPIGLSVGELRAERTLEWLVNDVLMVVFFFVVGMEIRREMHHGELSELRRAALPVAAALGGMVMPAILYLAIARDPPTRAGWGVPMATDIAFAVGVLTLLGKRVPPALRVLLLALAVIDDLGAIVVIALFYSSGVEIRGLALAALGVFAILALRLLGVRQRAVYVAPAVVIWAGVLAAGIHPTIAGVIVGLLTPVQAWLGPELFSRATRDELEHLERSHAMAESPEEVTAALGRIARMRREALSPAESLIEALHPWVAFVVMPLFALANAGVSIGTVAFDGTAARVTLAVVVGLVLGKPFGIVLASAAAIRTRLAVLPAGLGLRHLVVLGIVAGIGFTMALFVAQLAFSQDALLDAAKIGVLGASLVAGLLGLVAGAWLLGPTPPAAATSADEAEHATEL